MYENNTGLVFQHALQRLYDMGAMSSLMEFCQGEIRVLMYLDAQRGAVVCPSDISEALFVSRQRVTSVLAALRQKGFVAMETSAEDRRRSSVTLTEEGRALIRRKREDASRYLSLFISAFGEESAAEAAGVIERIADTVERLSDEAERLQNALN